MTRLINLLLTHIPSQFQVHAELGGGKINSGYSIQFYLNICRRSYLLILLTHQTPPSNLLNNNIFKVSMTSLNLYIFHIISHVCVQSASETLFGNLKTNFNEFKGYADECFDIRFVLLLSC